MKFKARYLDCCIKLMWRVTLFILIFSFSIHAEITGIDGKLRDNVEARLKEFNQHQSLENTDDETLKIQIENALYPFGYFSPVIQITRKKNLIFNIKKGPVMTVSLFDIQIIGEGKNDLLIIQTVKNLSLKQGSSFNNQQYESDKLALIQAAESQGYLHASFDTAEILIDKKRKELKIIWKFNTGLQYFFGQLRFSPARIAPEVLQKYLPFHHHEPYSTSRILQFNDYLAGSGYFKEVQIKPEQSTGQYIPLNVFLTPVPRISYSTGFGFGTDTGLRARAGVHVVPVNRKGHMFHATALASFNENALDARYVMPGRNPLQNQYELNGHFSNLNYDSGNSNSLLFSWAERHTKANFQRILSLNQLYERFSYSYRPEQEKYSFYPKASFIWMKKTNPLFSPNGYWLSLNGLAANKALLSDNNFSQFYIDAKAAVTIDALRTRLLFHTCDGWTQISDIDQFPLSLALLLGGSDNLKGYDYNSIGPGKILAYGGIEIQKELKEHWYLLGFFDAGSAYHPNPVSLKKDAGVGLMWLSPIGPIKAGIAEPIENAFQREAHRNPHLVISMGSDF